MDVDMPGMSGCEATQTLKTNANTRLIPIILVTGYDDRTSRLKGLYAGAEEFLSKPVDRVELIARVRNLLRIKLYSDLLADQNRFLEHQVRERTSQLRESQLSIVLTLGRAAEFRDDDSGDHVRRISHFTRILAQRLGMDKEFMESIAAASPLHDVGKIGIPDNILLKPGTLTVDEWQVMETHTVLGARILGESNWPLIRLGREIALSHHERWDGKGYPYGLKSDAIPLAARITNIAIRTTPCVRAAPTAPPETIGKPCGYSPRGTNGHAPTFSTLKRWMRSSPAQNSSMKSLSNTSISWITALGMPAARASKPARACA